MKYCPKCNALEFNDESIYCSKCGFTLSDKPRDANTQEPIKKKKVEKSMSVIKKEVGLIWGAFILIIAVLFPIFGFGEIIFMGPILFIVIAKTYSMLNYQLSPEEMTNESLYDQWFPNPNFDNDLKKSSK